MTDKEIIEGCRKGRKKAQDELYRLYSGRLFGICMRYTCNRADAEDVLQEGFVKIFKKMDTFREGEESSFFPWLQRIMVNTMLNYLRDSKQYHFNNSIEFTGNQLPEEANAGSLYDLFDTVSPEEILKIINALPDGCRTVFNLYAIEQYGHNEIAEIMGVSVNTSKTQLMKARRAIIGKLEQMTRSDFEIKLVAQ